LRHGRQVIRPTLADYEGEADFYSTPKGFNDFYELFKLGEQGGDWAAWQMPTTENPYIKASEVEAMRAEMMGHIFEQEILARFVALDGALFKREWFSVVDHAPADLHWSRYWDLGRVHQDERRLHGQRRGRTRQTTACSTSATWYAGAGSGRTRAR
jgi:hypothetical protein